MKRLAIVGAGDLGQLIAHHAATAMEFDVAGFFDDVHAENPVPGGKPVLGKVAEITEHFERGAFDSFVMGVGYLHMGFRDEKFREISSVIPAATLVHPAAIVDPTTTIAPGSFILPGCVIDANSRIGENCLINTGCTLAHDCTLRDNVFFGPNVTCAGFVTVKSHCFLGVSTTVIDNVVVEERIQTGAGAVVTDSLAESGLYLGIPAKLGRKF